MQSPIVEEVTEVFEAGEELPTVEDSLWLIVNGVVKTSTINEGVLMTLGFWGIQDVVGKSLSNIEPYLLECITDVEAIAVPKAQWKEIHISILRHGQQTTKLMFILRSSRVSKRLWLLLKWLANKFGCPVEQGLMIDFQLTHQELANAIGTTRITVTRILNQLEREDLIYRPKNKCIILRF